MVVPPFAAPIPEIMTRYCVLLLYFTSFPWKFQFSLRFLGIYDISYLLNCCEWEDDGSGVPKRVPVTG